jgi:hypothetical protein
MSSDLFAVEVPQAPVQSERYCIVPSGQLGGYSDIKFVPLAKAIYRTGKNSPTVSRHSFSFCESIVECLHNLVKAGSPQKWLQSARIVQYLPAINEFRPVEQKQEKAALVEPEIPKAFLAADGTYRRPPTVGFSKGPREWALAIAHVDRNTSVAYADRFNGATKLGTIQRLFDPLMPAWVQDYIKTLPLADPQDIPVAPEPIVEYVPTQAELAAAPAMTHEEFDKLPASFLNEQFILDPIFRARVRKMEAEDARKLAAFKEQEEEQQFREAAVALRKKKNQEADDEAFKTGGR